MVKLGDPSDTKQMENVFWTKITDGAKYSISNKICLFGDQTLIWNLNKFTNKQSLIHATPSQLKVIAIQELNILILNFIIKWIIWIEWKLELYIRFFNRFWLLQRSRKVFSMPGIQTPYTYVGGALSSFGFHLEDGNLSSINFNHSGTPKMWYIKPKEERQKLEKFCKKITKKVNCDFYLRHKTIMIPPSVLQKNNIKFCKSMFSLILFSLLPTFF